MIDSQKHLFDMPDDVAYFNTAYMSPLMHGIAKAMEAGMQAKWHPWTYTPADFFTHARRARGLAAQIYGTQAETIAIVPSASYGLQIAANALPLSEGQEVLVLEDQFPSNIYPWQDKARRVGASVRILPTPEDQDWTPIVLAAITDKTAIAALPQTHWASGATLDLTAIRAKLDQVGGALALDLTQSLGAQPFSVSDIRPDFAVAATYKWMMGPYSLAFLYIDPKWHDAEPLEYNWMNREGSEDFSGLTRYRDGYQTGAEKFDMGEKSNPSQLMGASAAMEQILAWGVDDISKTLSAKTQFLTNGLAKTGITALSEPIRAPHYLGLRFAGGLPDGLAGHLAAQNIFISIRGPAMRVTPYLYSSEADMVRLIDALAKI